MWCSTCLFWAGWKLDDNRLKLLNPLCGALCWIAWNDRTTLSTNQIPSQSNQFDWGAPNERSKNHSQCCKMQKFPRTFRLWYRQDAALIGSAPPLIVINVEIACFAGFINVDSKKKSSPHRYQRWFGSLVDFNDSMHHTESILPELISGIPYFRPPIINDRQFEDSRIILEILKMFVLLPFEPMWFLRISCVNMFFLY